MKGHPEIISLKDFIMIFISLEKNMLHVHYINFK